MIPNKMATEHETPTQRLVDMVQDEPYGMQNELTSKTKTSEHSNGSLKVIFNSPGVTSQKENFKLESINVKNMQESLNSSGIKIRTLPFGIKPKSISDLPCNAPFGSTPEDIALITESRADRAEKDYLVTVSPTRDHTRLTIELRAKIVDWIIDLGSSIGMKCDLVFKAVNHIDRYLRWSDDIKPEQLQLLGLMSFFVAAKMENCDCLSVHDLQAFWPHPKHTPEHYVKCEEILLDSLEYKLNPPTALSFFLEWAPKFNLSEKDIDLGWFFLEVSLMDEQLIQHPPSLIAMIVLKLLTKKSAYIPLSDSVWKVWNISLEDIEFLSQRFKTCLETVDKDSKSRVKKKFSKPAYSHIGSSNFLSFLKTKGSFH